MMKSPMRKNMTMGVPDTKADGHLSYDGMVTDGMGKKQPMEDMGASVKSGLSESMNFDAKDMYDHDMKTQRPDPVMYKAGKFRLGH